MRGLGPIKDAFVARFGADRSIHLHGYIVRSSGFSCEDEGG